MKSDSMGRPIHDRRDVQVVPGRRPPDGLPTWRPELPEPVPDHLCQLCERDLADWGDRDGLCSDCAALLQLDDQQEWVLAGGRTCRRCRTEVLPAALVDGLCPCGGTPW